MRPISTYLLLLLFSRPIHMSSEMMTDNEREQERGPSQYRNRSYHLTRKPMTGSEPQFESDMQNEAGRPYNHHSTSWEIEQLTDEEKDIFNRILKVVNEGVRERLPAKGEQKEAKSRG